MKKHAIVLFLILLSPLVVVFQAYTPSNGTVRVEGIQTQQEVEVEGGGTIKLPLGEEARQINLMQISSAYDDSLVNRMFEFLIATHPKDPYNLSRYTGVMLKNFEKEILIDHTVTLRNGTSSADIPGWGNTLGGPVNMTKWTLVLRDGYTWHDGEDITADDLVFSYQLMQWMSYFGDSQNLDQLFGPSNMGYVTCKKINDSAVEVYETQLGFYQSRLALFIQPVPKHVFGKASMWTRNSSRNETFDVDNWWNPGWDVPTTTIRAYEAHGPDDPILTGSGPWIPTYWDATVPENVRTYLFERYENYYWSPYNEAGAIEHEWMNPEGNYDTVYDPDDPYYWGPYADNLMYRVIRTETAEWHSFAREEIDIAAGQAVLGHVREITELDYPILTADDNDIGGFSIQCNGSYLTRHQKFRFALAHALDKRTIVDRIFSGYATPVDHPVSPAYGDYWYWDPVEDGGYTNLADPLPDQARSMIAENLDKVNDDGGEYLQGPPSAGWTDSDGNVMVTHDYRTGDPLALEMAELIQGDLKDAGIKVELRGMSWGELVGNLLGGSFMLSQHGWSVGGLPLFDLFWNESAYYSVYQWDHPESYYVNTYKFLNARTQDEAVPAARKCQEDLYFGQPFLTIEADQVVETYRISKWRGIVFSVMGGLTADSYRKMALVVGGKGLNYAEGFDHPDGMEVSGTFTFNGSVAVESPLPATIAEIWIDDQDSTYVTMNNETAREILGNIWSISYEVDTTELANGWHTFHYDVLTEELVDLFPASHFALSFYVDNPVPLTQQTLAMAAISGVVGAVVVGAVVYMVMRRRRPPAE
ncbi:MAG: hypothetical protein GWO20_17790 [Candidatus Korarchaeota archaeon]|nr:hypothetical protein [Candidatus Korarchaeota archaeon]NIU83833.1 hypothetical protein [Candidatus Thorarchaeota archaeon]NIW15247.1 hypothetical protein [Candidatus Thorarchaeota archaeon]NIW53224.1 hypothetical protein [Candidatus Korarchaeota archaeon]